MAGLPHVASMPAHERCPECAVAVPDVGAHRRAAHGRDPPFVCGACGFRFFAAEKLAAHAAQMHGVGARPVCVICSAGFARADDLHEHLRAVDAPKQMLFCSKCSVPFSGLEAIRAHMDEAHAGDWVRCGACPEGQSAYFVNDDFLASHRLAVHVDKAMLCGVCGHVSESQEANWWHRSRAHPTVFSLRCEDCGLRFRTAENLRLHGQVVHKMACSAGIKPSEELHKAVGPFSCAACPRTFGTHGSALRHYQRMHAVHACELCGDVFGTSAWLRWHEANCVVRLGAGCPSHIPEYVTW